MTDKLIFRYLTPVFNQSHFVDFEHSGHYKDATFSLSLKGYGDDPSPNILPEDDLNELLKYGSEGTLKNLLQMHRSERFFPPFTNVVLVLDVIQPLIDDREVASNTSESSIVFESIVSALRLHTSRGFAYEYSYIFRSPPIRSASLDELPEVIRMLAKESPGCAISRPHTIPVPSSRPRLGSGLSVFRTDQYDDCRATFHKLLEKEWGDTDTFDKILQLALEYHRTSFTFENIEHAFLILMVTFETIFKKESEDSAERASGRIAKLLSIAKSDYNLIKNDFFDRLTDSFSKIRNKIAHGDPSLDNAKVKEKYPKLYHYITTSIIALLNLPNNTIGVEYYNDLNSYVETRFSALPVR